MAHNEDTRLPSQARIILGTSSWTFEGWRDVFYRREVRRDEWLGEYARHFVSVEVNTSFYALPTPGTLIRWVESVPPGFSFALKFPRRITHEARLVDCRADTVAFLDVLDALGEAAGPALLQLPPSLSRRSDGRNLARYVDELAELLARRTAALKAGNQGRVAVEVRAPDLMTPAFARFLDERGFSLTVVDRTGTPDIYPVWREGGARARFVYVRWIGDDRNGPKGDRAVVAPRDAELVRWRDRIVELVDDGVDVYGYMHNPYEGHAPASVRRLGELLAACGLSPRWPAQPEASGEPVRPAGTEDQLRLL